MPPTRSKPAASQVRTERSHEENRERSYIAASHRSDRGLGPRVESARRASEIHKRRTGRSLRTTEADVLNEEMYEEEVDLAVQQALQEAHLRTQNVGLDRGLTAYLTSHLSMRAALQQAVRKALQHDLNTIDKSQYRDTDVARSPQQFMLVSQNPLENWAPASELSAQSELSAIEPLSTRFPTDIQELLAIAPTDFSFGDTMPSVGMHQAAPHKQSYSYKPNSRRKCNTPSPTSHTVATQSNTACIGIINRASAPWVLGSDTSHARPTAASTLSPAGYERTENALGNASTMDCLENFVDGDGPNGTIGPGESDWEKFLWEDAWEG